MSWQELLSLNGHFPLARRFNRREGVACAGTAIARQVQSTQKGSDRMSAGITKIAIGACASLLLAGLACQPVPAQPGPSPLSGIISSDREGRMEGVIVSARRPGSTITVSVVSDAAGMYGFPAGRLAAGSYELTIRAAGYDLVAPHRVDVAFPVDGQHRQCREPKQGQNRTQNSRRDQAGSGELHVNQKSTEDQHYERDIRIAQRGHKALAHG